MFIDHWSSTKVFQFHEGFDGKLGTCEMRQAEFSLSPVQLHNLPATVIGHEKQEKSINNFA